MFFRVSWNIDLLFLCGGKFNSLKQCMGKQDGCISLSESFVDPVEALDILIFKSFLLSFTLSMDTKHLLTSILSLNGVSY
jgi:hypothetical protein